MLFQRITSFFAFFLTLGIFALAKPVAGLQAGRDAISVITSLRSRTGTILPALKKMSASGNATDDSFEPLLKLLSDALNGASGMLGSVGSVDSLPSMPLARSLPVVGSLSSVPVVGSLPSVPLVGSLPSASSLPVVGSLPSVPSIGALSPGPLASSLPVVGSLSSIPTASSLPVVGSLLARSLPVVGSVGTKQASHSRNALVSESVAALIEEIVDALNGLGGGTVGLSDIDVALAEVLTGLDVILVGVVTLISELLTGLAPSLGVLNLTSTLSTLNL